MYPMGLERRRRMLAVRVLRPKDFLPFYERTDKKKEPFQWMQGDSFISIIGLSFEHHSCNRAIWLRLTLILREKTLKGGQGLPPSISPKFPSRLVARRIFKVSPYRTTDVYQHPLLLRDLNPGLSTQ
ncbi:hypothetical protein TNCV_1389601 [Trichonephila clavipes]|nr:hypothetical protein TNCV_1389601 [Trichonephila clavipes]